MAIIYSVAMTSISEETCIEWPFNGPTNIQWFKHGELKTDALELKRRPGKLKQQVKLTYKQLPRGMLIKSENFRLTVVGRGDELSAPKTNSSLKQ